MSYGKTIFSFDCVSIFSSFFYLTQSLNVTKEGGGCPGRTFRASSKFIQGQAVVMGSDCKCHSNDKRGIVVNRRA